MVGLLRRLSKDLCTFATEKLLPEAKSTRQNAFDFRKYFKFSICHLSSMATSVNWLFNLKALIAFDSWSRIKLESQRHLFLCDWTLCFPLAPWLSSFFPCPDLAHKLFAAFSRQHQWFLNVNLYTEVRRKSKKSLIKSIDDLSFPQDLQTHPIHKELLKFLPGRKSWNSWSFCYTCV